MKRILLMLASLVLVFNLSGCLLEMEESAGDYKMTFKVDGVSKTFYAGKFGLDTYDNTYNNFYENPDNDEQHVYLKFPYGVAPGTYTDAVSGFEFSYKASSILTYDLQYGSSTLTLTVTEWGTNDGDPISGTFSGKIYNPGNAADYVTITDGTFESALVVN